MYFKTRDEEVAFLKKLWLKEPVQCPACGEIYRTIGMLKELPER